MEEINKIQNMSNKLSTHRTDFLKYIDIKAKYIVQKLIDGKPASSLLLRYISELYAAAQSEQVFSDYNFSSAYHAPITSDLEFLISRILYHYSKKKNLGWIIFLRKQIKDTNTGKLVAPDIRIELQDAIVAIVEIKAKAGWMQPFFSDDRKKRDTLKGHDPNKKIREAREQLLKYASLKSCGKEKIFLLLPSFIHVHRNKYEKQSSDYRNTFAKNSTLNKDNLILLSKNTSLNLASDFAQKDLMPTDNFENFICGLG